MVTDITFDISATIILLFALASLLFRWKIDRRISNLIFILVGFAGWNCIYDFLIYGSEQGNLVWNGFVFQIMSYLHFLDSIIYPFLLYLFFKVSTEHLRRIRLISALPMLIFTILVMILNPITQVFFEIQHNSITFGPYISILSLNWIIYMLFYIVYLFKHKNMMGKSRGTVVLIVIVIGILMSVLQIIFQIGRLSNLGIAVSLMLLILFFYYIDDSLDRLTGLVGKDGFYRETAAMLSEDKLQKYLLFRCDIRHLKHINSLYGIEVGDQMLKQVAEMIRLKIEKYGTVGRLGSDDFVACIPVEFFQENIHEIGELKYPQKRTEISMLNICVGVYYINDKKMPVDLMCDKAEYALNTIRDNYSYHYAYYNERMENEVEEVRVMENDMQIGINEEQFHVYYQPIYDLNNSEIVSAEALVRWIHPTKGLIPPDRFIKLFEKNGFINELDEYVLKKVCRDLNDWKKQKLHFVPVSVNVSRVELNDVVHIKKMQKIIDDANIEYQNIYLEVTEDAFAEASSQFLYVLNKIREAGIKIMMDDFGSGYSSLNVLKNMPVDILKIDLRFLEKNDPYGRSRNILRYVILMAKSLNLPVIVEGVETQEQAEFLKALQCDKVQGYLYARPMQEEKYTMLIEE